VDGGSESGSDGQRGGGISQTQRQNPRHRGFVLRANFSDRAKGYKHGLVGRFADRSALEAYTPHPEHQRVVQNFISPIRADILALDYEL
jgi:hypothetical protein